MTSIFSKYRAPVFLVALTLYAIAQVLSVNMRQSAEHGPLEKVILWISAPPQKLFTYVIRKTHHTWLDYVYLVNLRQDYRNMTNRHRQAVLELSQLTELREENARLRKLLGFKDQTPYELLPAQVIAHGTSSFFKSVRINRGSIDGIEPGHAVVTPQGVVGQITDVSRKHSDVLLLVDTNSSVGVVVQRSRSQGILEGYDKGLLSFKYLPKDADVQQGDLVFTSGLDSVYPKGLVVGRVVEVERDEKALFVEAFVDPAVNFRRLEEILVVLSHELHDGFLSLEKS